MSRSIPFLIFLVPYVTNNQIRKRKPCWCICRKDFSSPDDPSDKEFSSVLAFYSLQTFAFQIPFHWTSWTFIISNNLPLVSGNDRVESLEETLEPCYSKYRSFCPIYVNDFESPSLVYQLCPRHAGHDFAIAFWISLCGCQLVYQSQHA